MNNGSNTPAFVFYFQPQTLNSSIYTLQHLEALVRPQDANTSASSEPETSPQYDFIGILSPLFSGALYSES